LARAAACPVAVLSGEEEAALAYAAVVHAGTGDRGAILAVDVGGATTELTLGEGDTILATASVPLGALALTGAGAGAAGGIARGVAATRVLAHAREVRAQVIASGGTATALAALDLGLRTYDPARVHGHSLAVARLDEIARRPGDGVLDEGRARILPAGAL